MVNELQEIDAICHDCAHVLIEGALQKRSKSSPAADIVDQQADLDAIGEFTDALDCVSQRDVQ